MGTETEYQFFRNVCVEHQMVKLNNPQMGTETKHNVKVL